jgi:hypothetical protein
MSIWSLLRHPKRTLKLISLSLAIQKEMSHMESLRHHLRTIVNIAALVAAVLVLPELGAVVPDSWLPAIGSVVAGLNVVLSWLRGKV